MPITREQLRKFINPIFIETGTFLGDIIQLVLDLKDEHNLVLGKSDIFSSIITIELGEELHRNASLRFKNTDVEFYRGSSGQVLEHLSRREFKGPITFWLDAHYSLGDNNTVKGDSNTPLREELIAISKFKLLSGSVILIDDIRACGTIGFDYLTLEEVKDRLRHINPDIDISNLTDDILVARIP